jgi:hypothetical protein
MRPLAGQRPQVAIGGDEAVEVGKLADRERVSCNSLILRQRRGDDVLALFRLQRAGAEHDGAAQPGERDGIVEEAALQRCERGSAGEPQVAYQPPPTVSVPMLD